MAVLGREPLLGLKDTIFKNQSYDIENFQLSSYELRVGKKEILLDGHYYREFEKDQIDILPHQITLISTEEVIKLPYNLMGQLILRFNYSTKGLDLLAGHIDPLFEGRIILALVNNSPLAITLIPGDRIVNLVLHQVSQDVLIESDLSSFKKSFTHIPQYIIDDWKARHQPDLMSLVNQHSKDLREINNQIDVMNSTSQVVITGGIVLVATTILSVVLQVVFASWNTTSGWVAEAVALGEKPEVAISFLLAAPVVTAFIFSIFIYLIAKTFINKKKSK